MGRGTEKQRNIGRRRNMGRWVAEEQGVRRSRGAGNRGQIGAVWRRSRGLEAGKRTGRGMEKQGAGGTWGARGQRNIGMRQGGGREW